jgi:hypothetical protein
MFCCGEYVLCTYVDDDYLSGWSHTIYRPQEGGGILTARLRKWAANPGWGDRLPPPANDRLWWDFYKAIYPGFKVDVFCEGKKVGTFKLSDGDSPVHYDHVAGVAWEILAIARKATLYSMVGIGAAPFTLEGAPKCSGGKLLIPHDGGITTILNGKMVEREVFA